MTNDELLTCLCEQGLQARYGEVDRPAAEEHLRYELAVIRRMGLVDYFLIAWDLVRFAREAGIAVSPRGSGAGSLVTYLLGISSICPLQHRLCFERFLNPERRSLPDLDIDFDWRRRDEVVDYCFRRYGQDRVARIATHNLLGCRGAVRVAGAGLGTPPEAVDRVAGCLPAWSGEGSLADALRQVPELRDLPLQNEPYHSLIQAASRFEGLPDHLGLHPCGVVISAGPLTDLVPLERSAKGPIVTQFEMQAVEAMGLLKLDLLGNRNLAILADAVERINRSHGTVLVAEELPPDDAEAFKLLQSGRTIGIYQLESPGVRALLRQFRPANHEDITAITSLYRPGPIDGGITPRYIARRQGREPVTYPDPCLEPILGHTYGTILFQEQCLQVAETFAGMTPGEADGLRRAIAKRQPAEMAARRARFLEGAGRRGRDPTVAEGLWAQLEKFAGYGFVKAHAASCAAIAIRQAYLKARWPVEYLASVLSTGMGYYPPRVYLEDARSFGAFAAGPCINRSGVHYTTESGGILRVGLSFIKGIGPVAARTIVQARGAGPYRFLEDFVTRTRLSRSETETLIRVGAMDIWGEPRPALCWQLSALGQPANPATAPRLFPPAPSSAAPPVAFGLRDYDPATRQAIEHELLGFTIAVPQLPRVEGATAIHRLSHYPRGTRVRVVADILASHRHRTRGRRELMIFLLLSDGRHHIQALIFPAAYRRLAGRLRRDVPLLFTGTLDEQDGEPVLVIQDAGPVPSSGESSGRRNVS